MGVIYILTSPSGKAYIGQTINNVETRWSKHFSTALNGTSGCRAIAEAIRKYGKANFKKEVLLICNDTLLNHYEAKFISCFNTLSPHGYNLQEGGSSSNYSEESRKKMSETQKLLYQSSEKMREQIKQNGHKTKIHKELPDYMTVETNYKTNTVIGYRVYRHPMCRKSKKFCSIKDPLATSYKRALDYLNYLNSLTTPIEYVEKPVVGRKREGDQTLPKYVIEVKKNKVVIGYEVNVHIKGIRCKRFSSSSVSLAENKKLAIEYLNSLKLDEKVQRLDGNGSDGASTSQA